MTVADLSVGPPGVPDAGTEAPEPDDEVLAAGELAEPAPAPVTKESVKGLVLAAANMLHAALKDRYPERPEVAVMTDDEADRIAGALVSMAARNPALRGVLERSDLAVLVVTLAGYGGRLSADIAAAKKERDHAQPADQGRGAHPVDDRPGQAEGRRPVGGLPPGHPAGGLRPPLA